LLQQLTSKEGDRRFRSYNWGGPNALEGFGHFKTRNGKNFQGVRGGKGAGGEGAGSYEIISHLEFE